MGSEMCIRDSTINLNEGLWGEFALPHVAFKDGRKVRKQGGSSDLI